MREYGGLIALSALLVVLTGCGRGSSYEPGDDRGVLVQGTLDSGRFFDSELPPPPPPLGGGRSAEGPGELNPNYPNKFIVPSQYSVALVKFELLQGLDDADPFVVFDTGEVAAPRIVDLVAGSGVEMGRNEFYPEPGTYTHVRLIMVYLEMELPADIGDGSGWVDHLFRLYASSAGGVLNGDVLVLSGGEWCWIADGGQVPVASGRPDSLSGWEWTESGPDPLSSVVQDLHFSSDDEESPDPMVFTDALAEPLVIPDTPGGLYVVTMNFDISTTTMYEDGPGTFVFDDVPNITNLAGDGKFKPGMAWSDSGESGDGEGAPQGQAFWCPLPPVMTAVATEQ